MPFGMVSTVSRGMCVLDRDGNRRMEGAVLWVNWGLPIVSIGDVAA